MKRNKLKIITMMLICLTGFGCLFAASALADNEHGGRGYFEREDQHSIPFLGTDNEGNETAGQIAAWLLLAANLPVIISILIKWTNRFAPLGAKIKGLLTSFNRFQKKYLMFFHYYLNLTILAVAGWHYISSKCVSTSLPEWGLFLIVTFIIGGILIKFKLCPKVIRKNVYQIHTQPMIFISMILVLTIGHLIVD
jgi:hypothetical protein